MSDQENPNKPSDFSRHVEQSISNLTPNITPQPPSLQGKGETRECKSLFCTGETSAARQKYLSSFVDTMKQREQRELGEIAVQLFLPSCTRGCQSFSMRKNSKPLSSQERGLERGLERCHEQ